METITITRVGAEKTIDYVNKKTGKPDSFKKVGVLTNEYGDRWMDVAFRGEVPVKVGQSYEVEISEREYTNRDGEQKKAYEAKLPRTTHGMNDADKKLLKETANKVTTQELRLNKLLSILVGKGILEMPEPEKPVIPGTSVPYPEETVDEEFDPFAS